MSLKWVIMLLLSLTLLSCQSNETENDIKIGLLENKQIETTEALFFVSDPVYPYYIVLDGNYNEDEANILVGETIALPFKSSEKIMGFRVNSETALQLNVSVGDKDFTLAVQEGENMFDMPSETLVDSVEVSLISGPDSGFSIGNILIQGYQQLDETAYLNYTTKKNWIVTLQNAIEWGETPMENLKKVPALKEIFKGQQLNIYGESVDLSMLESEEKDWIGFPVLMSGPVTSYEILEGYTKVEMKTGLTQIPVVIYFDEFDTSLTCITTIGIFLGRDESLKFYSTAVSAEL